MPRKDDDISVSLDTLPIFDGSSRVFVKAILESGVTELDKKTRLYQVVNSIRVGSSNAWAELRPANTFSIDLR